jgi:cellobiose phosphorylase
VRDLLGRVFKAQNADGDWPQWFMFFERERNIRPDDSHGDIVFWPVLALAQYLAASDDASLLEDVVPFFHPEGDEQAEQGTMRQHVERALAVIRHRLIPGTSLAAYGHGDWNDSLQPADPTMRERLCSAWTVTLHYQTLTTLAAAFRRLARPELAEPYDAMAEQVREEFQRLLVVDDVLAGFAYFKDDGGIDYLLHPRDAATGLSYSLLAMVHAVINQLMTPEQARHQLDLIERHLLGPDGARLFDRPMAYHGGPQRYFQRAESSTFFGREIGLMYTHAHLRYAEALWRYGDAEGFFRALCKANPIDIRALVPSATLRQSNCYYSSSDAAFADRYEAYTEYGRAMRGDIPLDGGWRIYSSGAGIGMSLILRCFLGIRREQTRLVLDPVIPASLDGLRAELEIAGRACEVTYRIDGTGCGPTAVNLNGADLTFSRGANLYRMGAAEVPMEAVLAKLIDGVNRLRIQVG